MSLPASNSPWPPPWADRAMHDIEEWAQWWAGTSDRLANYYQPGQSISGSKTKPPRSLASRALNAFTNGGTTAPVKDTAVTLHVPVPADVARLAGALMYANPPLFRPEPTLVQRPVGDAPTEPDPITGEVPEPEMETVSEINQVIAARLDELVNDDRTAATFLSHGEECSALGGGALRVVWDDEVDPDKPWIEAIDADMCIPEYTFNRLTAITFWQVYNRNSKVYRHFQRYIRGGIEHALYEGDDDSVGQRVEMTLVPELGSIIPQLDQDSVQRVKGFSGMLAVYVPNRLPNAAWRKNPRVKYWGASDFANDVLPLFAAVDEVWSSLMRDVRLGKGRLVVSESLLQTLGAGKGTWLDSDAEYLQRVGDSLDAQGKPIIEQVQFQIREGSHLAIIAAILREILRRVGISPMTFGLTDGVAATTATEIRANTRDTISTVQAKRRLASPELRDLVVALMAVDEAEFGGPGLGDSSVDVIWPPEVPVSDLEKAQTLTLLADSMSLFERVRYLHDDWDDEQIREEVGKIEGEKPAPIADPFGFTEAPVADDAPPEPGGDTA